MNDTVTLTIPAHWLQELGVGQDELRQALRLGLVQLRQQRSAQDISARVVQVLLSTGRVRHLSVTPGADREPLAGRQEPPVLPGPSVSEVLIAQRRGEA
jgi:hypothetical protein